MPISPPNVALTGLAAELRERELQGKPIRIGLVGTGEMGTDIFTQVAQMDGVRVGAVVERTPGRAAAGAALAYGEPGRTREVSTHDEMSAAIESGKIAVTNDLDLGLSHGLIDVVIDATGVPEAGADIGMRAIRHGKHLVMMNVECDVCIGPYLKYEADKAGVVYSLGAGDEPSACMELIEFLTAMGHSVVSAGKGKNNPLNFDAVPDDFQEEADRRNMNVRMLVEFVEGSKTMVEMAAIANATGLVPDIPGMHGPSATVDQLSSVLIPEEDGGVLSKPGCVDYTIGKGVSPGVFAVIKAEHPRIHERMADLKMGEGPYFTFHRPYHLTSLEVPLTAARIVLHGRRDMAPLPKPVAEVCAVAKRDIAAGEKLGAIGLYDYRSWTMTVAEARSRRAVPCGLLENGTAVKAIAKGDLLTWDNAKPADGSLIAKLRSRQDALSG
ncbi:NAD(P)H-dependent oxidoreductase [Oricola cellulosilytica]|uniref:Homoserine dehydrogenase n=1 Tax=Oricola cellulosilytica TaxID=1429082 RepID=A0A4R0P9V8_9HYPH|nr:SAF domain-containing protein [Oricola cellulosilytica]TCD14051.1 homoserine dehydrogenase [Oricola cellulosilytica]